MKKRWGYLVVVASLFLILLTGCGDKVTETVAEEKNGTAEETVAEEADTKQNEIAEDADSKQDEITEVKQVIMSEETAKMIQDALPTEQVSGDIYVQQIEGCPQILLRVWMYPAFWPRKLPA